jgi:multiple sugar transport system permease protein
MVENRIRQTHAARPVWKICSYTGLTVLAMITILPFVLMVSTGLKPEKELFSTAGSLFGSRLAWENFYDAWHVLPFNRFFANTLFVSAAVTLLEVFTSSLAGYAFARLRFPGRDTMFYMYLGTLMIPGQVIIVPQFILINYFGWVDTYQALILPAAFTAFGTFMLRQFFLSIPFELEDAARMDGCNRFGLYARILLPLSKPAIASLTVFCFVNQWNSFFWPLIITNSDQMKTISVGLRLFQGNYGTEWHLMMAASAIVITPSLIVFGFLQRYLVEGITMTGMGGK